MIPTSFFPNPDNPQLIKEENETKGDTYIPSGYGVFIIKRH